MTDLQQEQPPYRWAFATFLLVLLIYVATLAPTTAFWDTSEYIAAAKVLGIPHPPGNPLFVILAHSFGLLPLADAYAWRINLFAAVTSAGAAAFWFLVAERWLRGVVSNRWARYGGAIAGVLVGATSWTVWNQSTVNEKVYTVSLLSIAIVMWLVVRWGDDEPGPHRDRWLLLIAYVLALTSTNHLMGFLALPALVVYIAWTDWRVMARPWAIVTFWVLLLGVSGEWMEFLHADGAKPLLLLLITAGVVGYAIWRTPRDPLVYLGVLAVIVGISLNYLWLPLRSAQLPPINEGEPIGFQALADVLNRVQYGKPSLLDRQASFWGQIANFWQYFTWQFARDWGREVGAVITALFTVLGLSGVWTLWKRDRRAGVAAAVLLGVLTVGLVFYMNFKYGFSQYRPESLPREVRERDYFFMVSFSAFGVFVALGMGALMQGIVDGLSLKGTNAQRWGAASAVLVLALIPLLGNRLSASRAHETVARDFAHDMLQSVEPYGILITAGDNDTFPLWYAQEVEGIRQDVTLANLSLMNTDWHLRQLHRRVTPEFDRARAAAIWKDYPVPPRPTTPALALSIPEIDSLPEAMRVPAEGGIAFDSLQMKFGSDVLLRQDLATVFLIRDNMGKRPVYFSWSDGGYPDQTLGLSPYLVSQGFVRKLMPKPVVANDSIVLSQTVGYLDLPRTEALLENVYHWKSAIRDRPKGWIDPPSGSILTLYQVIYNGAARAFAEAGDSARALKAEAVSRRVAKELDEGEAFSAGVKQGPT
jgi:transmembrane protein TMEM260 (protein O-mannosyltransferase)